MRTGLTETGLWALDLMQDDLGYVTISAAVGSVIRDTIPIVLAEYGICVSMGKRAEDEAVIEGVQPNERMLYIAADFYMHECERPRFRGQGKSLARFEEAMREWSAFSHFTGPTGAAAALTTPYWHVPLPWTISVAGAALSQQRHSVHQRTEW